MEAILKYFVLPFIVTAVLFLLVVLFVKLKYATKTTGRFTVGNVFSWTIFISLGSSFLFSLWIYHSIWNWSPERIGWEKLLKEFWPFYVIGMTAYLLLISYGAISEASVSDKK